MKNSKPGVYEAQQLFDIDLAPEAQLDQAVRLVHGLSYVEALSCVAAIAGHWDIPAYFQPQEGQPRTWSVFIPSGTSFHDFWDAWRCITDDDPRIGPFVDWALVFPATGNAVHLIYSSQEQPLNYHEDRGPFGQGKDYI